MLASRRLQETRSISWLPRSWGSRQVNRERRVKRNAGFTLIELVAVMVILAILAVVAVPQFVDLRRDAANASAAGVGGAIASGTALNYATGVARGAGGQPVTGCTTGELATVVAGGAQTLANFTIAGPAGPITSGATAACTITSNQTTGTTAQNFTIIGCANASCT